MRGAVAVVLGLIGLQVLLSSNLPNLAPALRYPAQLAADWIDPAKPLIAKPVPGSSGSAPIGAAGANAVKSAASQAERFGNDALNAQNIFGQVIPGL